MGSGPGRVSSADVPAQAKGPVPGTYTEVSRTLRGEVRHVQDLELDAVGVVEEHGVVARHVAVLLGLALDLGAGRIEPFRPLVDDRPRPDLEREMVQPDRVPVDDP